MKIASALVRRLSIAVVIFILVNAPTLGAACETQWKSFVHRPSDQTFGALKSRLDECESIHFHPSDREIRILEALITAKDMNAIAIGFSSMALFDGGNLEDVLKALGFLADSDPTTLLRNVKANRVSGPTLETLLCSLPSSVVDDYEVQALWLQTRIKKISAVRDPQLMEIRETSLRRLEDCASEIKRRAKDW